MNDADADPPKSHADADSAARDVDGKPAPNNTDESSASDPAEASPNAVAPYGSSLTNRQLRAAFTAGEIPVAVYGLGKMGLPLAAVYAKTAGNVVGVDVDPTVVEAVNDGESHVEGEPGLPALVAENVERGRLEATSDGQAAADCARIHVIIVPTLLDDEDRPDLSTVEAVADDVATGLEPGDLVIAESTLPPGTCRDVLRPHLAERSGLDPDSFGVAFCPERTSSGTALRDIRGQYPKVVGGVDPESTRVVAALYDEITTNEVHAVSDATTAEAVKVFEGIYRDANIALANDLARVGDELGISAREAFETANALPMCQLHDPGPGVGGHCIPFYPHFVLSTAEAELPVVRSARAVNDDMPRATVDRLAAELEATGRSLADARVAVLGLTYRPGVEETRASPAVDVVEHLRERGTETFGVDPLVDPAAFGARPAGIEDLPNLDLDAAVVVTPHDEFENVEWDRIDPLVILDGRDALTLETSHHRIVTLGGTASGRDAFEEIMADEREGGLDSAPDPMIETDGGDP